MNLVVISHKQCWHTPESPHRYVTDGGFPLQMEAISNLFSGTRIVVPCIQGGNGKGLSAIIGNNIDVVPLTSPKGKGVRRKFGFLFWLIMNGATIVREVRRADAVHTPVPGDVGTIGMLLALLLRKPLFVRHCGNWLVQRTLAERFWKWVMERYAGDRNVMLATGGGTKVPSEKNRNIKWIFSTSLTAKHVTQSAPRKSPSNGSLRLVIACRQEERKGTDIVIDSMPLLVKAFRGVTLDVIGDGSRLPALRQQVETLGVTSRVTFHGKVSQPRVLALLGQADIFCYPTTASEGFPKVVIEALARGLPVVTTEISVLPHLISHGCGFILKEPTPASLAEAIKMIGLNERLYSEMSAKAFDTAASYTLENWESFIGEELCRSWGVHHRGQLPSVFT